MRARAVAAQTSDLATFLVAEADRRLAPWTREAVLAALRRLFDGLVLTGRAPSNPARLLDTPRVTPTDVAIYRPDAELEGRLTNQLRAVIIDLRTELHREIGGLRTELHAEIGGLRSEMHQSLQSMARAYVLGNVALVLTVVVLAFGAARFV